MTTGSPAVVLGPNPPDPPKEPAAPPKDPAAPPRDPAAPPKDPAAPPKDPAAPPKDPAAPPKDPAVPPSDPAVPPRDPGAPPLRDEPVREQAERRAQAHATMQAVEEVMGLPTEPRKLHATADRAVGVARDGEATLGVTDHPAGTETGRQTVARNGPAALPIVTVTDGIGQAGLRKAPFDSVASP
jgi:hypothetical protein